MKTTEFFEHQAKAIKEGLPILITEKMLALFFDPGLGKTLTALALADHMVSLRHAYHVIVVSPKTLIDTWAMEIEKHAGGANILRWDSSKVSTKAYTKQMEMWKLTPGHLLTNYEAYQSLKPELSQLLWEVVSKSVVIADESTRIKTHNAKQTKGVIATFQPARARMILTGTEITKSPLDVYSQFEFLRRKFWPEKSFYEFRKKFACLTDVQLPNGVSFKKITGYMRLNEIQDRIEPYVFRAKKADCFDLPDKIHEIIPVELSSEEKRVYKDLKKHLFTVLQSGEIISVQQKMTLFMRFRTITGGWVDTQNRLPGRPSKLATLVDLIDDDDQQAIIWCSFTHEILMVEEELSKYGSCVIYYGGITQEARDGSFRSFVDGSARFFIANPAAAGWGLNLQHCTLQYFYSLPTSPEQFLQALDRSHRIGTKANVVYRYLLGKDSVDFRIKELLDQSSDMLSRFQTTSMQEMIGLV